MSRKRFIYQGYLQIAELDAADASESADPVLRKTYLWDPLEPIATRVLAMSVFDETGTYVEDLYYTHDALKNTTALFGIKAGRRALYEYGPYGNVLKMEGNAAEINPFRFSSEYFDEETGLVQYNFRYYNPKDGRWISRDLINLIDFRINISNYFNIVGFNKNLIDKNNNQYSFISNKCYLIDKYGLFGWLGVAGLILSVGLFIYALKKLADSVDEEKKTSEDAQDAYDRGDYDEWAKCCDKLQEKRREKCKKAAEATEKGFKLLKPRK